jgi:hypothetical protein
MPTTIGGTFGSHLRAFHIAARVTTAMATLSGFMDCRCCGTCMNGMLRSKPHTLPICTRNNSAAAAFWNPAITGCGANLINVPSRARPNSACSAPPSRTTENVVARINGMPPVVIAGISE